MWNLVGFGDTFAQTTTTITTKATNDSIQEERTSMRALRADLLIAI
jgi:hypothetical protein